MSDGRGPTNDAGDPARAAGDSAFAPEERELRRHSETGVVTGVCAGLGEYTRVDPVVWRVAFSLTALSGLVGVLLYILAWLVMRDQQGGPAMAEQLLNRRICARAVPALLGAGLAVATALSLVGGFGWGTLVLATPLILGVLVAHNRGVDLRRAYRELPSLLRSGEPPPSAPAPAPAPAYYNPAQPWAQAPSGPIDLAVVAGRKSGQPEPGENDGGGRSGCASEARERHREARRRRREARERRREALGHGGVRLYTLVFWILLVATGLTLMLTGGSPLSALVGPETGPVYLGSVVVIIGLALLVGAWVGDPRGLMALGLVGTLLLVAVSTVDVTSLRFGAAEWRPQTAAEAEHPFGLTLGGASLDLTGLDLEPGQRVEVSASVAAGELDVAVPDTARVDVHATSKLGRISVDNTQRAGTRLDVRTTLEPSAAEARAPEGKEASGEPPRVVLHLASYVADVEVWRATP
ncbi:hypothetical protein GCM10009799_18850 [Nocardiopsis rhodophaea]|uniref:Phage shock protein PspC N-terminal domain-containing protein n=1 Tax=Nocardiopsis rhodophaea TaxID=280238 RepID=A0ABN2SVB5_9ACTN